MGTRKALDMSACGGESIAKHVASCVAITNLKCLDAIVSSHCVHLGSSTI